MREPKDISLMQIMRLIHTRMCEHVDGTDSEHYANFSILGIDFTLCPQCYKELFEQMKRNLPEEPKEVKTTVTLCKNCHRRHGGEVADTEHISWRCKKCKWHNSGKVTHGVYVSGKCYSGDMKIRDNVYNTSKK